jgi:hypothetical protein
MTQPVELGKMAVENLELPDEVTRELKTIQAASAESFRESFLAMVEVINRQAAALVRIQTTLELLVRHFKITEGEGAPTAFRVAGSDEEVDLATALVVPDPIGAGYTLSQAALAKAMGIGQPDVSILVEAFKLKNEAEYAVTVRSGAHNMINYHPRVVGRFLELIKTPPSGLNPNQRAALKRVQRRLLGQD